MPFIANLSNERKSPNYDVWRRVPVISALGLDIGRKRIGVAGCDRTGLIAAGLTTIQRSSFEQDLTQLKQIVAERQVQVLVAGLPYSMNGTLGFQARQVEKFAQRLTAALHLPLEYVDERLTSIQAEELLLAERLSPSRHKDLIDRKAAALILQQWLDQRRVNQPQASASDFSQQARNGSKTDLR